MRQRFIRCFPLFCAVLAAPLMGTHCAPSHANEFRDREIRLVNAEDSPLQVSRVYVRYCTSSTEHPFEPAFGLETLRRLAAADHHFTNVPPGASFHTKLRRRGPDEAGCGVLLVRSSQETHILSFFLSPDIHIEFRDGQIASDRADAELLAPLSSVEGFPDCPDRLAPAELHRPAFYGSAEFHLCIVRHARCNELYRVFVEADTNALLSRQRIISSCRPEVLATVPAQVRESSPYGYVGEIETHTTEHRLALYCAMACAHRSSRDLLGGYSGPSQRQVCEIECQQLSLY